MTGFTYRRGALLAMFGAGPVTFLPIIFFKFRLADAVADPVGLVFTIAILILSGAMGAFLPILLGGYVMASWGDRNPRARHPALWGVAGGGMAALMAVLLYGTDSDIGLRTTFTITSSFAITGAVCALLTRFGTRWDDEALAAAITVQEGEV